MIEEIKQRFRALKPGTAFCALRFVEETGERLPVIADTGAVLGDSAALGTVEMP